jgi:metallo-beta-lactamase family protein
MRRTDILFVGYQAAGTPGRDIQTYGPRGGWVMLAGQRYDTLAGYSAHADQRALVGLVRRMRHKPKEIRLVHGDGAAKRVLQKRLQAIAPDSKVWIP